MHNKSIFYIYVTWMYSFMCQCVDDDVLYVQLYTVCSLPNKCFNFKFLSHSVQRWHFTHSIVICRMRKVGTVLHRTAIDITPSQSVGSRIYVCISNVYESLDFCVSSLYDTTNTRNTHVKRIEEKKKKAGRMRLRWLEPHTHTHTLATHLKKPAKKVTTFYLRIYFIRCVRM